MAANPNMVKQTPFFPETRPGWPPLTAISCNGVERILSGGASLKRI